MRLVIALILLSLSASAQVQYIGGTATTVINRGAFVSDSVMILPKRDTTAAYAAQRYFGRITMGVDSSMYFHNGTKWVKLASGSISVDSNVYETVYRTDTAKAAIRAAYVPYTGATGNVNLGAHSIKATKATLDTLEPNSSAGLHMHNAAHQDILIAGAGGGQNLTIYAPTNFDLLKNLSETDTVLTTSSSGTIKKVGLTPYLKKGDSTLYATKNYVDTAKTNIRASIPNIDFDGNTTPYFIAGTIRPTRDTTTGKNTWSVLDDSDHTPMNIDSVSVDGSSVYVFFKDTVTEVGTFVATPDESMIQANGNSKITPPATTTKDGGYKTGSRVFREYAQVYISKPYNACLQFSYNGSSFDITNVGNPYNLNSPVLNVTYSSGRIRVKTTSTVLFKGFPRVTGVSSNGTASLMYVPFIDYISSVFVDFYFWDLTNNAKLTSGTCPTGLTFTVDFGTMDGLVNPQTTDFGGSANFWVIGLMKK